MAQFTGTCDARTEELFQRVRRTVKMYAESAVQLGKIKEVSNLHEYVCPSTLDVFLSVVSYCPRHLDVGADINADDHNAAWDPLVWDHDNGYSAVVALDLLVGNASLQVDAILGEDGSKVSRSANFKVPSHDPRDKREDGDFEAKVLQRVTSLETEDTTDDDSLLLALSLGPDSIGTVLVLEREDALEFVARKRRDEAFAANSEDELVVLGSRSR